MSQQLLELYAISDNALVQAFIDLELDFPSRFQVSWQLTEGGQSASAGTMSDATSSPALKLILDRDGSLIHRFNVRTTHPSQGGYLDFAFVRENEGRCRLTCSFPEQVDRNFLDLAKAMLSVDRAFDRFRRKISPTTDSIANDALARQESRLIRLEEIALKVTKSTQAHRDELDVLYTKKCQDLDEQTRRLRTELNEEFESKKTQLSLRKDAIAQKEKELERITNTDARRRLQQTIKSVVEKSHNNFSLTQKTSEKRNPVRNTFWALIAASGALTGIAVWQAFAQPTDVSSIVRATLSLMLRLARYSTSSGGRIVGPRRTPMKSFA